MQQYLHVARNTLTPWHLLFGLLLCISQPLFGQELQLSVEAIEFPNTFIGEFSEAIVSYENIGEAPVTFEKIDFSDEAETDFEIVNSPSLAPMEPGDVRNIRVRFTPSAENTVNSFLVIETLVPDEKHRVSLRGRGQIERLRLSFDELAFGSLEALSVLDTTLVLENPSNSPVTITSIALTDPNQAITIIAGNAPGTLTAGNSRNVVIRFAPLLPDTYETGLAIQIAEEAAIRTVPITATGIAGNFTFTREVLEFESTILRDTSEKRIQFTNTSPVPLIVTGYSVIGDQASSFEITEGPATPITVIRGDRPEVVFNFIPQEPGLNEASLIVQTNVRPEPFALPIFGDARAGIATLSATELGFNRLPVGADTTASITITNTGFAPFAVSEFNIAGEDATGFSIVSSPFATPIAPNEERTLTIQFTPQKVNEHTATLSIYTGLPDSPTVISLSGLGGLDTSFIDSDTPAMGSPLAITVRKSGTEVWNLQTLYYKRGGESAFQGAPMIDQGDRLEGLIPQSFITPRGIDYYIELSNNTNTLTIPTIDPAISPYHLQVQTAEIQAPMDLPAEKNRMISIPLNLDAPMLADILEDDYGEYNNREWRLHRWNTASATYDEYDEQVFKITPGQAYWLVTREGTSFDVGSGYSVSSATPFALMLAPGWNQIANPFAFAIDWAGSLFTEDPVAREQIEAPVAFDGDEYRYDESMLQPWQGYFVFNGNADSTQINLRPVESTPDISAGKGQQIAAGSVYSLQLSATMPDFGLIDTQNFIGFGPTTSAETSRREAPPLEDHVRLSIQSESAPLASQFKPLNDAGAYWDVEISRSIASNILQRQERVTLSMKAIGNLPNDFALVVIDKASGQTLQPSDSTLTFMLSATQPTRTLRFLIGNPAFTENQLATLASAQPFALHPGYPNPFRTAVALPYALEAAGHVELTVYDLLGRRVASLVDTPQPAGVYEARWEGYQQSGRPVSSGIYIVQLKAGAFSAARRIVLSR